jgi:hypothetical protein
VASRRCAGSRRWRRLTTSRWPRTVRSGRSRWRPASSWRFATPNFLIQEQSVGLHYHQGGELLDYLVDPAPFRFVAGHAERTDRPGLGIEIDEKAVIRLAEVGHRWRNPVWRRPDGSFTEW